METLISTSLKNRMINALLCREYYSENYTYIGLSTTQPTLNESGEITNVTEPSATEYYKRKRICVFNDSAYNSMSAASDGKSTNTEELHFNQAKETSDGGTGWGNIQYYVIYNSEDSTTPLLAGQLTSAINVEAGSVVVIREGELVVKFDDETTD